MLIIELSAYCPKLKQEINYQFSDIGYFDVSQNKIYPGVISDSFGLFTEVEIGLDQPNSRANIGDIKLYNHDGELDEMVDKVFTQREIKMYIGSEYKPRSQFELIFSGYIDDIFPEKDFLSLKIKDKLESINKKIPLKELIVNGETKFVPLCLGECFNISPILVDPANHIYQVHDGEVKDIIEVRDDGVKIDFVKMNQWGKFQLVRSPFGNITCDVQGAVKEKYIISSVDAIRYLIDYSKISNYKLNLSDANYPSIGLFISSNENLLDLINQICASNNTFFLADRFSDEFRVLDIFSMDLQNPSRTIEKDEILEFSIESRMIPLSRFWIHYAKNWTVQENTAGSVTADFSNELKKEFLLEIFNDQEKNQIYRTGFTELSAKESLLINKNELLELGKKWLDFYKEIRTIYTIKMVLAYDFYIGMCVNLNYDRFSLRGKNAVILGINEDFVNGIMIVKVVV